MRESTITQLPPRSLSGLRLAFSASRSDDLERLGLTETHVQLALGEIARAVLVAGGALAYGGSLKLKQEHTNYTLFLINELKRFAEPRNAPLLVYQAWTEHRKLSLSEIKKAEDDLSMYGRIIYLDSDGNTVDKTLMRNEPAPDPDPDSSLEKRALTGMRRRMADETSGRVLIGGKRRQFNGKIPGLMEEVELCLDRPNPQPVYLAGGFGGCTADIIKILGSADMSWLPPAYISDLPENEWCEGRDRLCKSMASPVWQGLINGLNPEENQRLAATHRPSEIAELVVLGLGRLHCSGRGQLNL